MRSVDLFELPPAEGRKAVSLASGLGQPDWAIPVLYLRAPDGVLWDFESREEKEAAQRGDVYESITVTGGVVGAIGGRGHRIEQHVAPGGDVVHGDKVMGDKVMGDKIVVSESHGEMPDTVESATSLRRQLAEAEANLELIRERKAQYVLEVDVPLQLVKEERRLLARVAELKAALGDES